MLNKEEARLTLHACGLSLEDRDPFIVALASPKKWAGAVGIIAAGYAVLLIVRLVVC